MERVPNPNRFIENFRDGLRVNNVYLVKTKNAAVTKNGKEYLNVCLQDRTGTIDAKVWEPNSPGISDFSPMDYVYVEGNVSIYNGVNQLSIQRLSVASEGTYAAEDFLPVSKHDREEMGNPCITAMWGDFWSIPCLLLNFAIFTQDTMGISIETFC